MIFSLYNEKVFLLKVTLIRDISVFFVIFTNFFNITCIYVRKG